MTNSSVKNGVVTRSVAVVSTESGNKEEVMCQHILVTILNMLGGHQVQMVDTTSTRLPHTTQDYHTSTRLPHQHKATTHSTRLPHQHKAYHTSTRHSSYYGFINNPMMLHQIGHTSVPSMRMIPLERRATRERKRSNSCRVSLLAWGSRRQRNLRASRRMAGVASSTRERGYDHSISRVQMILLY